MHPLSSGYPSDLEINGQETDKNKNAGSSSKALQMFVLSDHLVIWWSSDHLFIIWWFGDHLIIWWFGDHLIIWWFGDHLMTTKNSSSMGLIVWLYATPFAASSYNYYELLSFGDHLVIAQPQRSLRRRRARTERPRSASPLQVVCRCCSHHHHHHQHHRHHHHHFCRWPSSAISFS